MKSAPNILIAPDKFKGSLSALKVAESLARGIRKSNPNTRIKLQPMADGGDGSLAVLDYYYDLRTITKTVQDPLGRPLAASYKMLDTTAYIELAAASGLVLLQPEERNCLYTTTFGTGELIADALAKGAKEIYLFIGGSATNDGGIGIAQALGYQFYDAFGHPLAPIGKNLAQINKIDSSSSVIHPAAVSVKVICDVNNPFSGVNGAAYVYAAQKGANDAAILLLDKGLKNLAQQLIVHDFPDISQIEGAGAAGGVGGGAIAFLGATLVSGIQTFLELTNLEAFVKDCDLIITGEGKLDQQTEQGKVISGVCRLANQYKKPVIAVCGDADFPIPKSLGLEKVYTVRNRSVSLDDAMQHAADKLQEIAAEIMSTFKVP